MTLQTLLSYLVPSGGFGTLIVLALRSYIKKRAGKLSRADLLNSRAEKAERLAARYLAYIWLLLARWPADTPKPPWPRGLKPKD